MSYLRPLPLLAIVILVSPAGPAEAVSSQQQKAAAVQLCIKVIDDYIDYLAGRPIPRNVHSLKREYENCAKIIGEYEDVAR